MSKLMSLEKIEGRIKTVVELTEHTKYTSLKALSEDSGMPQYQLRALLLTGFLFKSGGMYHCVTIHNVSISLKNLFFFELAEVVQDIYKHRKFPDVITSYEVQYNHERILESAERKLVVHPEELEQQILQDYQVELNCAKQYSTEVDQNLERGVIINKKKSFWQKLKNFFTI